MRRALTLALLVALAGCGSTTRLRPTEGMSAVPKAAAADRIETAAELMTPSTQAQPDRQADLLTRSVERQDDPFALPPGPNSGRAALRGGGEGPSSVPKPTNTAQDRNDTREGMPRSINPDDDRPDDPNAPPPNAATPTPAPPGNSAQ
ncbi:hypothetical protein [Sphingobium nicotianae]|uniref:Uncharacterized protein n=1 Tax=Sphingobium nicotianae TaxID=2782607 RepID=A0A9X1DEY4_9SPHN|nr:hypothetical protein [Sphingobium nicotianae]MBT2188708.1 hypothetical protein [Sphingobium nicotianae]